jgi:Uri superfamily endonuclease
MATRTVSEPGTYVLILRLREPTSLSIGRLGRFDLPPGWYLYVGSAFGPGGLAGRLAHHSRPVRRPHWHIDYLRVAAQVRDVWWAIQETPREHEWAGLLAASSVVTPVIPGFGASDCCCRTHLFFSPAVPVARDFAQLQVVPSGRWASLTA